MTRQQKLRAIDDCEFEVRAFNGFRRYIYGWQIWWAIFYKSRTKKHGAGPQRFFHATKSAAAARHLVDGQHCKPPRLPRYLR